jgi:hypothetical protein
MALIERGTVMLSTPREKIDRRVASRKAIAAGAVQRGGRA